MTAYNFEKSLKYVLVSEGGWTNDPHDPGGATMYGIIQREYDAYCARHGLPKQSVRYITVAQRADIYKTEYWDALNCDALPNGVDYCVFDAGVNSGVARAKQWRAQAGDNINRFCDIRLAFLKKLKTWVYFGRGWSARVASVRHNATLMSASKPLEAKMNIDDITTLAETVAPAVATALGGPQAGLALTLVGSALGAAAPHTPETVAAAGQSAGMTKILAALGQAQAALSAPLPAPKSDASAPVPAAPGVGGVLVSTWLTGLTHAIAVLGGIIAGSGLLDPAGPLAGIMNSHTLLGVALSAAGWAITHLTVAASNQATTTALK